MSKFKNILCLDIDDALLPAKNFFVGTNDDVFDVFEMNMKRIHMFIEKYDMGVFITSSWYTRFTIDNGNDLGYKQKSFFIENEIKVYDILKQYTQGRIVGLSCGSRIKDIITLLNRNHCVVAMDDMDLSRDVINSYDSTFLSPDILDKNYLFVKIEGFFTNRIAYSMFQFLGNS